jgi:pseudomonalisin
MAPRKIAVLSTFLLALPSLVLAETVAVAPRAINAADRVIQQGAVSSHARPEFEVGRTAATLPLRRIVLQLAPRAGAQTDLETLLAAQQNPASPSYHHWLTPKEFGARFGLSDADLAVVTQWLQSQGFTVDEVAQGRGWLNFSGTVGQVEKSFATEIRDYKVAGSIRHANATAPSLPRGLADLVKGVVSLNGFERHAHHRPPTPRSGQSPRDNFDGDHALAPGDFAVIYNLTPAYSSGVNGSGETIAIVARSDIKRSDVTRFRNNFGLPANPPIFVHNGDDPGIIDGDDVESDLDTEWAGAVAPNAAVKLVISASTEVSDGVMLSAQYIVDQNLADVSTTSYGLCEQELGASQVQFYESLLAQSSAQGTTSLAAAGDSGVSDCDDPSSDTGTIVAVDNPCSSAYATCAGGTEFNDTANPSTYWSDTVNPTTRASALSYIPELVWNESGSTPDGEQLWSTGGGASSFISKPSWQSAPGVPADGHRDVPDIALSAARHDGYLIYQDGDLEGVSGTSAAAPTFAAIVALIDQKAGSRQGNVNPGLYQLAQQQYGSGGAAVFHDVTAGNNTVPGVGGFRATAAYDRTTGLGSVNVQTLLAQWSGGKTVPPPVPTPCVPSATTMCLESGRFTVSATFDAGTEGAGAAQVVKLTDDTGYLWFFADSNVEAVVKVLNGCGDGGHYWVFAGGLTNVSVVLTVQDSQTGAIRTYTNPANTQFAPVEDTTAFSTCP